MGIQGAPVFDGHAGNDEQGAGAGGEEKKTESMTVWESPVSPMRMSGLTAKIEDDAANSGGEEEAPLARRRKRLSSWSRAHRRSSDGPARSSGEHDSEEDETWKVEELEVQSSRRGSHDGFGFGSQHHSASSGHHSDGSVGYHRSESHVTGSHHSSRSSGNHSSASDGARSVSHTETHDHWSDNEDDAHHTLSSESSYH